MDEALLQRLREASGLRIDNEGRFLHEGEPIEHERLAAALHKNLHRAPDGRFATRLGTDWAYVAVDDVAFFVRSLAVDEAAGELRAELLDGRALNLDPDELSIGHNDALYVKLPGGERARLSRAAQLSLSDRLQEEPPGTFSIKLGDRRHQIGQTHLGVEQTVKP